MAILWNRNAALLGSEGPGIVITEILRIVGLRLLTSQFLLGQHTGHRLADFLFFYRFGIILSLRLRNVSHLLDAAR